MTVAQVVDWCGIGLLALALAGAVVYYGLVRRALPATPLGLPLLLVLAALLVCHLFAVDRRYSSWRILVWCGYLAVFYLALAIPPRWVGWAASVLGWLVTLACVAEFVLTRQRVRLLGNPNITAAWLLSLAYLMPSFWPWWWVGGGALLATGSRGALFALLGVTVAEYANLRAATPLLLILALCFVAIRPATVGRRLHTWKEAGRLFLARPLVGWGPGCYPVVARYEPLKDHADSFILTVAAETGLVGLAAWGWLFVTAARAAFPPLSSPPLGGIEGGRTRFGLAAWGIHNLVDDTLWWYWVGLCVMVCLARIVSADRRRHADSER